MSRREPPYGDLFRDILRDERLRVKGLGRNPDGCSNRFEREAYMNGSLRTVPDCLDP